MHKILFYNKFIICLYMFRALLCSSSGGQNCIVQHLVSSQCWWPSGAEVGRGLYVSSTVVLIIRRSKLYYIASGIIIPVGGRPVHRLKEDYMFRALLCSSSGGQNCIIQHLVSSHCRWPSGAQVERGLNAVAECL